MESADCLNAQFLYPTINCGVLPWRMQCWRMDWRLQRLKGYPINGCNRLYQLILMCWLECNVVTTHAELCTRGFPNWRFGPLESCCGWEDKQVRSISDENVPQRSPSL